MTEALEVINSVISQHAKVTEHVKLTGDKMNDIDAVFNVQRAAYKAAWSAASVTGMLEKRDQMQQTIDILEEGLKKHFSYEEKVLPLVFGELLMKDILKAHTQIQERIQKLRTTLKTLEELKPDELYEKRTELLDGVNDLRTMVHDHARAEENILNIIKKIFEDKK